MKYSVVIPVYNRPDEVSELLESLVGQTLKDFEVVVVEDGSKVTCKDVVDKYASRLQINYLEKENGGPGPARNYGVSHSQGEYVLILDSDCVLPQGYMAAVDEELRRQPCDAFGGPDAAHDSFTPIQKAINYSMTSFFTTGGIRGGKKKMDKFYPRSFNMGIRRAVYDELGGFSKMSRLDIPHACFLRLGCGISAELTSTSSSSKYSTRVLPELTLRNVTRAQ